VSPVKGS
jgi:hypothetical protein